MDLLEYFQNQKYANENYVVRKHQIPEQGDINLYGVRGSGKTAMVLDFLEHLEEENTLYVDFDDPNMIFATLSLDSIQSFITLHDIKVLVLDHFQAGSLPAYPRVDRLIVVTRTKLPGGSFNPLALFPLDYEEFLAFDKTVVATNAFNHFLRSGTLPALSQLSKSTSTAMNAFLRSRFDLNEQKLLVLLANHHTKHLTTHQIFTFAKERFKVSKDWLYRTIKHFKEEGVIFFIDDKYQKSGKKMLLFDFALAKHLTTGQPFITQFDTMVALALIKHGIRFKTLSIHGYITHDNELIIPAPFESEESIWAKSQKKFSLYKKHGVKKITIVTVANSYEYQIEKIHFEALPFYEWTVLEEEEEF